MPLKTSRLAVSVALISITAAVGWALASAPQPAAALTAASPGPDPHATMDMAMPGSFFNVGPFMPHGGCYLWTQSLILLHTLSDGAIGLAYFTIPIILLYFVRRRGDLKFKWIFVLFAAFVMACGTTHLMEIWNIWHADYWLAGCVKAFTALVSVGTTLLLVKLMPVALALPSAEELRQAHAELEIRVTERTAELAQANRNLQAEIAERQRAEDNLRRTERALRTISDCNQMLVRANTEEALLQDICRVIVESGGYRMACVGFAENDANKSVHIASHAGFDEGYLEQLRATWADTERGRGPIGTAIRTGQIAICQDAQADPNFAPWRAAATRHGFASLIVLPLRAGEITFGALGLYAATANAFNAAEIELLKELADDLAYGIQTLRTRLEHARAEAAGQRSEQNYREIFNATNEAIFLHDADMGRILDVNDAMLRLYGYATKADVLASGFEDLCENLPPYTQAAGLEKMRRAVAEGPQMFEWRARKKNGDCFWAEVSLRSSQIGGAGRILAVTRDITERKRAERALIESGQFLQSTIDALSSHLCVLDEHGVIVATNQAWDRFAKTNPPAFQRPWVGVNYLAVCDQTTGPEALDAAAFAAGIRAVLGGQQEYFSLEYPCHAPTEQRWFIGCVTRFTRAAGVHLVVTHEDITAPKLAETALRTSESAMRAMAEAMPQMVWVCTPDGRNIYFNQQWVDYTGLTLAESHGTGWIKPFHPDDQPRAWAAWENAVHHHGDYSVECRLRRADGTYRWWLIRGVPQRDESGMILKWFGTCTDIEDMKQAEAALQASEARFRNLLQETESVAVQGYAPDGTTQYWNRASERLYGYTAEQAIGRNLLDLIIPPEMRDGVKAAIQQMAATGRPIPAAELSLLHQDGSRVAVFSSHAIVQLPGRAAELFCIDIDLTGRKQAEKALGESESLLRSIMESSTDVIFVKDRECRFVYMNPAGYRMNGQTPGQLLGRSKADFHPNPTEAAQFMADDQRVMQSGGMETIEEELGAADGTRHVFLTTKVARRDSQGNVIGLIGMAHDIAERKRAETALRKSEELFSLFMRHSPIYTYIKEVTATESRVLEASDNFMEMIGIAGRDMLGKTMAELFPAELAAKILADDWAVVTQGAVLKVEEQLHGRHYTTIKFPVVQGERTLLGGYTIDITERKHAEQALGQRVEELAALNALGRLVNASLEQAETMQAALAGILDSVRPDLAFLFLREGDRLILQQVLPAAARARLGEIPEHRLGECMCGLAVREKKALYSRDILTDLRCTWEECKRAGIKSFAALPLMNGDEAFGVLGLASDTERDFLPQSRFLETLANQISVALVKTQLFETTKKELAERQRAEAQLRASEVELEQERNLLRTLVDHIPDMIYVRDLSNRFLIANHAFARRMGVAAVAELIGKTDADFYPAEVAAKYGATDRKIFAGDALLDFDCSITFPNGEKLDVLNTKVPLKNADGEVIGLVGVSHDITARKLVQTALRESEAEREHERHLLRTLIDQIPSMIFVRDLTNRFLLANQAFARRMGVTSPAELVGKTDADFFPSEEAVLYAAHDSEIFAGRELHDCDFATTFPNGEHLDVLVTKVPLKDADGEVVGLVGISHDITARKLAETALRESEARYRELFELETDAIVLVDCETHRYVDFNLSAQQLYGYSREELLQMTPEDISTEPTATGAAIGSGPINVPLRWHRKKNGELFAVEMTGNQILYQGRRTDLTTIRDITARQQVMEKLQNTTLQLLEAQRIASLGSYVFNVSTGTWTSSEVLDEVFGFMEHGVTRDLAVWLQLIHPQDRAAMQRYLTEEVLTGRTPFDRAYRIIRQNDQAERWVHGLGRVTFGDHGQAVQMAGVIQDITESKQAEEKMHLQFSALTAAANAIFITDRHGKIEWVNPAFTKLTGFEPADALGKYPRILKSGQQPPAFYANLWATVTAGNAWHGELVNKHKDGRLYTEEMTITPVRNAQGRITHFVAIKQDVTERRQFENRLQQAQKMEAIGTLAGGIAHDFNNMLAAMFGFCYLLQQDTEGNPAAQESIAEILKAANRAKDLVQQILTFSRQREQKRDIIRLDTVVKEAAKFLRASLPAQIKTELHLAPDAPTVLAEPTQIYQVTMNLATNALHAMEGRTGTLTVKLESFHADAPFLRAHPELKSGEYARLTIADTGHGMDAKTMARIFEPFFTTKPVGKGTGLGLAVVHGIIQSHEGAITVESQVGMGSTFHLYFPAQKSDALLTETTAGNLTPGQGQNILLVDDKPALTTTFTRLLTRLNYHVTSCRSAREALALCQENPAQFDLVITDLTMPEMNGLELARQLHARRPELPIVLASGFSPDLTPEDLQDAGICELLEKPISLTVLAEMLQRTLAKP